MKRGCLGYYNVFKSAVLLEKLTVTKLVKKFPAYFPKIYSNIILPSKPRSHKWSVPLGISK